MKRIIVMQQGQLERSKKHQKMNHPDQDLYTKFQISQQLKEVQVPTRDIDVQIYLRKLQQPICLFGEGPKERKDRLRMLLIGQISDLAQENNLPEMIPKYEIGSDLLIEAKKLFIDFSVQRAKARMYQEKQIDKNRIEFVNNCGKIFHQYETFMSCPADRRPLTSIASFGDAFIVGSISSKASIWSYVNSYEHPVFELKSHTERITSVGFLNNSIAMTASADRTVKFWDDSDEIASIGFNSTPTSLFGHPMGRHALIGLSDGTFAVFDVSTNQIISQMKSHDGSIPTICAHNDGGLVMTGGSDFFGRLWDLRSMKMVKVLQGHGNRITCGTFDNNFHSVTGSADNSIIIWDLRNLSRSKKISAHTHPVSSVCVYDDLIVSSSKECVKIWSSLDFRTYKTISDCPSPITGATITKSQLSNLPLIFTSSHDGSWRMYLDSSFELP
ncbi:hypothetical protein TRFO_20965 [Tritrichomonas foetus]|uniref:Pre-mRNA processing factor 4 (PRP4)-like domain-containing protein n=1 Tax=Tritrichomonas foetus TaxID=1144522 RepID=A0A1J4KEU4_9EUKA|nr:hypothetical protein TRFO_20965 [Tritrichomonas foetus]|eukprot:OHT09977.1 hypothetical protein TRFO_20965 [Tritrichomonas foetus]